MGWPFGGRNEVFVSTSVSRVIEDNLLPNLVRSSASTAIFRNESISEHLIDGVLNSFAMRTEAAMRYARGSYAYGLPNHTFLTSNTGEAEIKAIVEALHGTECTMIYTHYASLHMTHWGMQELVERYSYHEPSNTVFMADFSPPRNMQLAHLINVLNTDDANQIEEGPDSALNLYTNPDPDLMEVWEAVSPSDRTPISAGNKFRSAPVWQFTTTEATNSVAMVLDTYFGSNSYFEIQLGLDGKDIDDPHFQAKYSYTDSGNTEHIGYFTYDPRNGGYPQLTDLVAKSQTPGEFLPFMFYVSERQDLTDDQFKDTEEYKTSKVMGRKLGMDWKDIGASIQENPDASKVESGVMIYAVPMNTEDNDSKLYIYDFFSWIMDNEGTVINSDQVEAVGAIPVERAVSIEDADFRMTLSYGGLGRTLVSGSVGDVDDVTIETQVLTEVQYTVMEAGDRQGDVITKPVVYNRLAFVIKKQVSGSQYEQLIVSRMNLNYLVAGRDVRINTEEDLGRFLIPLNYRLVKERFNLLERDVFYSRSLHLVFNSKVIQRMPWYTTTFFKFILTVVAVVIFVVTWGTTSTAISTAFAEYAAVYGAAAAAVLVALEYVAVSYVSSYVLSFVADELGAEVALALGVLLLAVGVAGNYQDYSWAGNLLTVSTNLIKASSAQFGIEAGRYQAEQQAFELYAEEQYAALKEVQDDMNNTSFLDPYQLLNQVPIIVPGEGPSAFYDRTIHAGNVGTLAFDYIEGYVDHSLRLPTFSDTINGIKDPFNNKG